MIIKRNLSESILRYTSSFKVTALIGPRQAGKTTLLKNLFPHNASFNLEDPSIRARVLADPSGFIEQCVPGTILDEIQRVPELLSFIQAKVDKSSALNAFLLTGSANLLLMESVTQSLAGRCGMLELLPLDFREEVLNGDKTTITNSLEADIFRGQYPGVVTGEIQPLDFYRSYAMTFLERDVRQILEIRNIHDFERFIRLCAGRTGQILNLTSLSNDCGISVVTCKHWLAVLETCYIVKQVFPYNANLNKRLTKNPKLFFLDSGLASYLVGIESQEQLVTHPLRGALFETLVYCNLLKVRLNQARASNIYFFRDSANNEVDFIIDAPDGLVAVEAKSSNTFSSDFTKGLNYFASLTKSPVKKVIYYGGESDSLYKGETRILNYREL